MLAGFLAKARRRRLQLLPKQFDRFRFIPSIAKSWSLYTHSGNNRTTQAKVAERFWTGFEGSTGLTDIKNHALHPVHHVNPVKFTVGILLLLFSLRLEPLRLEPARLFQ